MTASQRWITPVLIAGSLMVIVSFGVRAAFGVFQIPIATEFDWPRAEFSLAIAIQNLAWGIGQPVFGAIAEKFGDRRALFLGALIYVAGLVLSAYATTPLGHQALSVLVGFGVAGTGFGVIFAIIGRATPEEHRSMALGVATAAGSVGQMIGPPLAEYLMLYTDWSGVFLIFAGVVGATVALLPALKSPPPPPVARREETLFAVVGRAFRDPSYVLIFLGFFSCGYQIGFMTAHFPALVAEWCAPILSGSVLEGVGVANTSQLGAWAIAIVGATNIGGSLLAGKLGGRFPKKYLLANIYMGRVVVCAAFILTPITPLSVIVFSVAMGALWLATVPLTAGLVGYIYGMRYMATLYGFIFLSHQIGAFVGVWLGGALYDRYGNYELVWWVGIGVSAFSALVHLPVKERPLAPA